ncbi:MAG TPA: hypothetical protein VFR67_03125 [Pilimelia sp.]|nr:hypothetical protein [Pilimelia sp.]
MFRLPPSPSRRRRAALLLPSVLAGAAVAAACGTPPELRAPGSSVPSAGPSSSSSAPATTSAPVIPTVTPRPTPTAPAVPSFAEAYAMDCAGHPTGAQVIRVLRATPGLLGRSDRATVRTGPLCAGTWQYTVVTVPGREPLAVVTKGRPSELSVVTAGTDVCSIPVRTAAPAGIRAVAACQ